MPEQYRFIQTEPLDAALNMAIDESMHLHHLDVVAGIEQRRGPLDQRQQDVDSKRHVGRPQDRRRVPLRQDEDVRASSAGIAGVPAHLVEEEHRHDLRRRHAAGGMAGAYRGRAADDLFANTLGSGFQLSK